MWDPTDNTRALRWQAQWIDRPIVGVSDDATRASLIDAMEERFEFQDEWVDGVVSSCRNDLAGPKPDR